jgi:predicted transcriptional regulator
MVALLKSLRAIDSSAAGLGRLESSVMEIVWLRGESSVRDVAAQLERPLAYTTVMTTLDRLYKKNLLDRRKAERAFLYSPRFSRSDWERKRADTLLAGFLMGSQPARDLLISCLVEAVGQYDEALLNELEKKVRAKRKELLQRNGK